LNRPIRSYVLRQGRTTPAQKRALEELYPRYGIAFSTEKIASARKLVLEIGSGMGETTVAIAKARPEVDFIAVEVHGPGVGSLLNAIDREKLSNLRVIRHDALDVLGHMIGDGTLAAIHLFFPDPWPKKRHHKRRLVQPEFAACAARKLEIGGILHAATDWPEYAQYMEEVFAREPLLGDSDLWQDWFAAAGLRANPRTVAVFNDAGLMLQAAEQNLGLALTREILAADALVSGGLVRLSPITIRHAEAQPYHLAYPPGLRDWPPVASFRRWLYEELERSLAELRKANVDPAPRTRRSGPGAARKKPRHK